MRNWAAIPLALAPFVVLVACGGNTARVGEESPGDVPDADAGAGGASATGGARATGGDGTISIGGGGVSATGGAPSTDPEDCTINPETGALIVPEAEFCADGDVCHKDRAEFDVIDCSAGSQGGFGWTHAVGCGVESFSYSTGYVGFTDYFDVATQEWVGSETFTDVSSGKCNPWMKQTGRVRSRPCDEATPSECKGPNWPGQFP
jgi:hypothetical protein